MTDERHEIELVEIEPGKWRVKKAVPAPARADLPLPSVISDSMEPTEQVDGRFYTSKRAFRAAGRALGLIEVGTEKFKPKQRATDQPEERRRRRDDLKVALERYKAGQRPE
jgi:hypothetical protein